MKLTASDVKEGGSLVGGIRPKGESCTLYAFGNKLELSDIKLPWVKKSSSSTLPFLPNHHLITAHPLTGRRESEIEIVNACHRNILL